MKLAIFTKPAADCSAAGLDGSMLFLPAQIQPGGAKNAGTQGA
jgi:hypothetical protein